MAKKKKKILKKDLAKNSKQFDIWSTSNKNLFIDSTNQFMLVR